MMPHSVKCRRTKLVCNMILMLQSMEVAGQGSSEQDSDTPQCKFSKMRIIRDTILMLGSVNGREPRVVRNITLMLRSAEVIRQRLSGIGY